MSDATGPDPVHLLPRQPRYRKQIPQEKGVDISRPVDSRRRCGDIARGFD